MRSGYACVIAAALACGTEPIELASSYSVSTVNGKQPPQLVGATVTCDVNVGGGNLRVGSSFDPSVPVASDYFELFLNVLEDCSRAGGGTNESSYGYTGTIAVEGRRVVFTTARGGAPYTFEGQVTGSSRIAVSVPLLVPVAEAVTVELVPE
jgi:hypothetical protein